MAQQPAHHSDNYFGQELAVLNAMATMLFPNLARNMGLDVMLDLAPVFSLSHIATTDILLLCYTHHPRPTANPS